MVKKPSCCSLLLGRDSYLKEEALSGILSSDFGSASKQMGLSVFYAGQSDASAVISAASIAPMPPLAKKVVLIRHFEDFHKDDRAAIINFIKNIPHWTHVVIETEDESIAEDIGSVRDYIDVRRTGPLNESSTSAWIRSYVSKSGKKIDEAAARYLAMSYAAGLNNLCNEIDKLLAYIGQRPVITLCDAQELVVSDREVPAFGFADAIAQKDARGSLEMVSGLLSSGKSCQEIVGSICWQLRRLVRAKKMEESGMSDYSISGVIGLHARYREKFFAQLANFTAEELEAKMDALLEADADIKRTRFDPRTVLETAVMRLCL